MSLTDSKPNFICIGAQRAGTTWLAANLSQHPDIWLTPYKEIHYFNHANQSVPPSILPGRLKQYHWVFNEQIKQQRVDLNSLRWFAKFALADRQDDSWYCSLFDNVSHKIAGEITPAYSTLNDDQVAHVASVIPNAKILLIIRNPIDRVWSHLKFKARQGKIDLSDSSPHRAKLIEKHIDSPESHLRTDYVNIIERWQRYFPSRQFKCISFDRTTRNPEKMLAEICEFLELEFNAHGFKNAVSSKINSSTSMPCPISVQRLIAAKYIHMVEGLGSITDEPVEDWATEMSSLLN